MLPSEELEKILPSHFILNKPKDIVSGDYYWVAHKDGCLIIAVADCTGHGVPGAFMSIMGINFLNEIVNKSGGTIKANEVLNELRDKLIKSLGQTGHHEEAKDGMEMAREFNLPRPLRHFIESHHGTTLVEYFYHAAKQKREAEDKPAPTEFEFRYPGPKPQTKEAAIMLLCDGIEGAARALPEPTPVRLEQVVNTMARKRLMDGQFDECDLTLRELSMIEASIAKTIAAHHHGRIAYPKSPEEAVPAIKPVVTQPHEDTEQNG